MQAVESFENFYARREPESGLVIGGTVVFSTRGWTGGLRERADEGNTCINPAILFVDQVLTGPPAGTAVTDALTPFKLPELKLAKPELEYRAPRLSVEASGG